MTDQHESERIRLAESDIVARRRWQADLIEKRQPPKLGDWNIPAMLREDADEIESLRAALKVLEGEG